jgi:citrate synthase
VLISTLYALSCLTPEANPAIQGENIYKNIQLRNAQIYKILGILPTLVARIHRHIIGLPPIAPHPKLGYVENFLYMMDRKLQNKNRLVKALEMLWIVHS